MNTTTRCLLVAALLASCSHPETGAPEPAPEELPVLVVGAGMSGLAAAASLEASGIDAVVLEARDRIGGRTHTADVDGATLDLGGAWIHGPRRNPIARLSDALGLERFEDESGLGRFASDDAEIDGLSELRMYLIAGPLLAALTGDGKFDGLEDGEDRSVADFVDAWIADSGLDERDAAIARFAVVDLLVETEYACDASELSLRWFYEEGGFSGGDWLIDGGYGQIVDHLAQGLDVRLEQVVERVVERDGYVRVHTRDGATIDGSAVVMTVPLGVLNAGAIAFEPPLDAERTAAMGRLGMAHLEKVILRFDERFWGDTFDGMAAVMAEGDAGHFDSVFDFTEAAGAPTLAFLYGGGDSREVQENWSDERILAGALDGLRLIVGPAVEIPEPRATHVTRWHTDPFARGSYSFIKVGGSPDDHRRIARPHGLVHFAGEATSAEHSSTVHGALMSGLREAERLGASREQFWATR